MGSSPSKKKSSFIRDNYNSISEVQQALRMEGLESSNLIFSIDYTCSNQETGKISFGGRSLHALSLSMKNPYEEVIEVLGETLEDFDDDHIIPSFGFGDIITRDKKVFPFFPDKEPVGFAEVLARYREITPGINMCGPTSFVPIINKSIEIIEEHKGYHILVIITDGKVTEPAPNTDAIVRASFYPLSIICIGVGDGPWEAMHKFDDDIPSRKFDNFQFVEYNALKRKYQGPNFKAAFALHALMEIPEQFKYLKKSHLI